MDLIKEEIEKLSPYKSSSADMSDPFAEFENSGIITK